MPTGVYQRTPKPLEERFWAKVRKSDGCWEWTGAANRQGYGRIALGRASGPRRAHRIAWELTHGPVPDGLWVLHHCDNPPCVRPDHLWLGTRADNARDCRLKGRMNTAPARAARALKRAQTA